MGKEVRVRQGWQDIDTLASAGIADVVDDTTPTLGGELDAGDNDINMGGGDLTFGTVPDVRIYGDDSAGAVFWLDHSATQWAFYDSAGGADRAIIDRASGDLTITGSITLDADATISSASGAVTVSADADNNDSGSYIQFLVDGSQQWAFNATALLPSGDGTKNIGHALLGVNDLFFDTGSIINWDNGDVTLTHSANLLTLAGGDLTVPTLTGAVTATTMQLPSVAVASVGSASPAGRLIYVSDEAGGPTIAFSDGTNWRRVQDRNVVT